MELYFLTAALFATGNIILSLYYFIKIKERWRYIKLWYVFANLIILGMVTQTALGDRPEASLQYVGLIILLSSQFAGMVVSLAKVKAAESIKPVIDKLSK